MKKLFYLSCSFLLSSSIINAQEIEWQNVIGGSGAESIDKVFQTTDGAILLGGSSGSLINNDKTEPNYGDVDYWIVKVDINGIPFWQKSIGGGAADYLTTIDQTSDGGFILGGKSNSDSSGLKTEHSKGGYDYWIVKIDSSGIIQWQRTLGGSGKDELYAIRETLDGGYILGGFSASDSSGDKSENSMGLDDYWVIKIDSGGNVQWQNTIGGSGIDYLYDLHQTSDGGYLLGGYSESGISGDKTENSNGQSDIWIVKINSSGIIQWQNSIGGSQSEKLYKFVPLADGSFVLGGSSSSNISGDKTEVTQGSFDFWVIKIDSTGSILWQRDIGGLSVDNLYSINPTSTGGFVLGGNTQSNISGNKTDNCRGSVDYWVVEIDSIGNIINQNDVGGLNGEDLGDVQQISDGSFIACGSSFSDATGDKTESDIGNGDFWVLKLSSRVNQITGNVFIDLNSNAILDSGDIPLINHLITESNTGRIAFTNNIGNYSLSVHDSGNFSVAPASVTNFTRTPLQSNVYFASILEIDSLNDFAIQPVGTVDDLQIEISPASRFRPGFKALCNIHYQNIGTTSQSPIIIFYPDSLISFDSSTVTPAMITTDSVVWQLPALNPYEQGNLIVYITVDTVAVFGDSVNLSASIQPVQSDATPTDNSSSWIANVTGSFDPNDILVNRASILTTELSSPPFVEYMIRFQNTGNDTAFTVKINNPISSSIDLSTFEILQSSHPVSIQYLIEEKSIWFGFMNINLPDSNINEPQSHGFLTYRIKPLSTLIAGDLIGNKAYIYFDFNAAVETNTALTEILLPTITNELKEVTEFNIYPNPAESLINVVLQSDKLKSAQLEISNILGKTVKSVSVIDFYRGTNVTTIPVHELSTGFYFVILKIDNKIAVKKFLKM